MKLSKILVPECIRVPLESSNKNDAIAELVTLLADNSHINDRDAVLGAVMEREATRSTGIGHGLAVPHCKSAAATKLVLAAGKPRQPLDFDSKDGKPITFVVLLVSPIDQTGPHIQALARISRLMLTDEFCQELDEANTPEQILKIIREHEV